MTRRLDILQVNTADAPGGAERIARELCRRYRSRGHGSWLAVGRRRTTDPGVLPILNHESAGAWRRFWWGMHQRFRPVYGRIPGSRSACRLTHRLAEPAGWLDTLRGIEDFHYPGTHRLLELPPRRPEVLHLHNLHGRYFDLRALPEFCRQVPVVMTLHDAWLTTGHCAHSLDCDRWKTGCGECSHLSIYPGVRRDRTAYNRRRKQDIFAACRLYVATPSRWLMRRVERSILAESVVEARVIPNGVDLDVFRPGDRQAARARLGIGRDMKVLLFSAFGIRNNPWKDYPTLRAAVARLARRDRARPLLFLSLGESAPPERIGRTEIRFVPHVDEPSDVAAYYRAADIYVHAARADTFPNSILEALACGTPVVASAVGGIPEQIRPVESGPNLTLESTADDRPTGVLTPPGDAEAMAREIERLLEDNGLRSRLGANAARDARARFGLDRQADAYLAWFEQILGGRPASPTPTAELVAVS